MNTTLANFTDVLVDEICNSQPLSLSSSVESRQSLTINNMNIAETRPTERPLKGTGQRGQFRSTEEIDPKYRDVFSYPYFNLVQSSVIEDALYSDKSIVVCAPTGSGKTVVFEMAIVQLLMELEDKQYTEDFKIIYMAPVKALCTERLTEWYSKFTKLGLLCIEVTGDTDVDFTQLKPYKIIITTPEKWDMLTRRWRDHRGLVEVIKLFLIDEVHILNDETRGPVLEAVVSRMKTIENSAQSVHRIEQLQKEMQGQTLSNKSAPRIRFVAVSATVSNPEDVANWLGTSDKPAVFYKFGDECRPVKLRRIVEGYPCAEGTSIFKFDIILNYKLWPIIQKYHSGKPTLIFCNTRKSVILTAETLSRELTISFNAEQKAKLTALASSIKNKKLQALVMSGVGCHHAGLLYEERQNIEFAFRNRDLPILITTTTLAMGVNLPAHLVIVKNTQHYVNGAYQEYSISTVLQMVGRAGRPQFDTEATAVIMTRLVDKPRYQALVGGCEPLQSFLHKRLAENLNSEAALHTVGDVAQCVQWLRSTFLYVRAAKDPKKYLGLPQNSPQHLISKKIEELCVKAMNGLATAGLITMDEASCIESTEAGRLMSIFYLDLETMKQIMKIKGTESLERLLTLICESHELADMHLRVDERRCLNTLNRNNAAATIRFPMKGKISTRQMKLNCIIQAVLGCLSIPDPSLNQEAMKIMRIADRVCKCLVTYVTRPDLISQQPRFYAAVLNSIILAKCVAAHLWENSPYVSKQLKGIGPTFSTLLASAGKVNFMLLEESHPRDLERIMNKGAPAGNVLRKQVSLLPKYQLTMIPVDEKTVTIQLVLLNQSHLSENIENLTAGDSHKSYIIVGDSNNNLLLLAAFKDRDLISIYDGKITHTVRRKHSFEHKIFAHCISSSFVGIDVQSEYLFNDLDQFFGGTAVQKPDPLPSKKITEKQTCITDTFKERKRKNSEAIEQSKEKRKRENAIIENFKYLKDSFEAASKNLTEPRKQTTDLNIYKKSDTSILSSNIKENACPVNTMPINDTLDNLLTDQKQNIEDIDSDEFIDDEKIDSILNEIENEMCKSKSITANTKASINNKSSFFRENPSNMINSFSPFKASVSKNIANQNFASRCSSYRGINQKKRKFTTPKSNYNFIDLLERNLNLSDDDDKTENPQKDNGFSDTIKNEIQKYLLKTKIKTNVPDTNVKMLLDEPEKEQLNNETNERVSPINLDYEVPASPTYNTCPRYEIKEILGGNNIVKKNSSIKYKYMEENVMRNDDNELCDEANISNIHNELSVMDATHYCANSKGTSINPATTNTYHELKYNNQNENKSIVLDRSGTCDSNTKTEEINNISVEDAIKSRETNSGFSENITTLESHTNNIINEVTDEFIETTNTDINNLRRDTDAIDLNEMRIEGRNNNPINVVNTDEFNNLNDSKILDALANDPCSDTAPYNLMLENNAGSDNTFIKNIEKERPSICLNDKSNFNPPVSSFNIKSSSTYMNAKHKMSYNSSTDIDVNKQNTEYIKKYTYSASKIDVCTKETTEYSVQVIKKMKMDLDITAIVSRKHNSFQNYETNFGGQPNGEEGIKVDDHSYYRNSFHKPNESNNFSVASNNVDSSSSKSSKYELPHSETTSTAILPSTTRLFESGLSKAEKNSNVNFPVTTLSTCELPIANINSNQNLHSVRLSKFQNSTSARYPNTDSPIVEITPKPYLSPSKFNRHKLPSSERTSNVTIIGDLDDLQNKNVVEDIETNILQVINQRKEVEVSTGASNSSRTDTNADEIQVPEQHQSIKEQDNHWIADQNTGGMLNDNDFKNNLAHGVNQIKSILQKYSTILAKNAVKIETPSCSGINRTKKCNNLPATQSKKPFKITDIHKLHASLPNTIVEHKRTVDEEINRFPIANDYAETTNANCDYRQSTEIRSIKDIEYESISDLDLEPLHLPSNIDLEASKDFKIDQTMFDPKALLQCAIEDDNDEILPPPPEFCDGMTDSPGYVSADVTMADEDEASENHSLRVPQFDSQYDNQFNGSIFNESCATNLTPSTEIETWNLSQEDSWTPLHSINLTPPKSFTVMRKNTHDSYYLQNSVRSRQMELGKFQFRQKNKLKIRK